MPPRTAACMCYSLCLKKKIRELVGSGTQSDPRTWEANSQQIERSARACGIGFSLPSSGLRSSILLYGQQTMDGWTTPPPRLGSRLARPCCFLHLAWTAPFRFRVRDAPGFSIRFPVNHRRRVGSAVTLIMNSHSPPP
jgi:hypothetical protein